MTGMLRDAVLDAWALLMPITCVGCGADDRVLCASCRPLMTAKAEVQRLADGTPVVSALSYEGVVRHAILAFKERGRTDAGRWLAAPLAAAIAVALSDGAQPARLGSMQLGSMQLDSARLDSAQLGPARLGPAELVTVPASRSAFHRRGYDPVSLLVRRAGYRPAAGVFLPLHHHGQQKKLGREARRVNLRGSMRVRRPLAGRRFVLVDDVVTTGSTLLEASRAIRDAGGMVVSAATLAFTPRLFAAKSGFWEELDDKHRSPGYGV